MKKYYILISCCILIAAAIVLSGCVNQEAQSDEKYDSTMETCSNVENLEERDECYYNAAISYDKTEPCDSITTEDKKSMCLAVAGEDTSSCPNSIDPERCYMSIATRSGNAEICYNIKDKHNQDLCVRRAVPPSLEECDDDDPDTIDGVKAGKCINLQLDSYCSSVIPNCEGNEEYTASHAIPCERWVEECSKLE